MVLAIALAVAVDDVTRSLSYLLPIVPMVVVAITRRWPHANLDRWFGAALIGCVLVPAVVMTGKLGHFNPLPLHLLRWMGIVSQA